MTTRRRALRAIAVALTAPLWVLLAAVPAAAHARLMSSWPAAGAVVGPDVRAITLRFDDVVTLVPRAVVLITPGGRVVPTTRVRVVAQRTVRADIAARLASGTHSVRWRILADDGHVESGRFGFTVAASARSATSDPTRAAVMSPAPGQPAWPVVVASVLAIVAGVGAFTVVRRGLAAAGSAPGSPYPATPRPGPAYPVFRPPGSTPLGVDRSAVTDGASQGPHTPS